MELLPLLLLAGAALGAQGTASAQGHHAFRVGHHSHRHSHFHHGGHHRFRLHRHRGHHGFRIHRGHSRQYQGHRYYRYHRYQPYYRHYSHRRYYPHRYGVQGYRPNRKLEFARRQHRKATELVKKGLRPSNKLATARKHFRTALGHDARARKVLEKLKSACGEVAACVKMLHPIIQAVEEQIIDTHVHIADLFHRKSTNLVAKGLRTSRRLATSRNYFRAALTYDARALRVLEEPQEARSGDRHVTRVVSPVARAVRHHTVQTNLHIAQLYTSRQSYHTARKWVNKALATEPRHREALDTRARLEILISDS